MEASQSNDYQDNLKLLNLKNRKQLKNTIVKQRKSIHEQKQQIEELRKSLEAEKKSVVEHAIKPKKSSSNWVIIVMSVVLALVIYFGYFYILHIETERQDAINGEIFYQQKAEQMENIIESMKQTQEKEQQDLSSLYIIPCVSFFVYLCWYIFLRRV